MKRNRRIWVVVAVLTVVGAACEPTMTSSREVLDDAPPGTDAGDRSDEAAPLPAPTVPSAPANGEGVEVGVERIVDTPLTTVAPTPTAGGDVDGEGMRLVAVTPTRPRPFELDGAVVAEAFDARLEVESDVAVERVEWELDGTMFRDDDLQEPFSLRYASQPFPLDQWVESDQELPGQFRAAAGSTVELSATVVVDGTSTEVQASFRVGSEGESPAPVPAVTAAPTITSQPTTTTAPSVTTTTVTTADVSPGAAPWSIPTGESVAVALPQGRLGPRSSTAVDPSRVPGISFSGGVWTMNRDWDELSGGGYLDFGAAALRPNGHRVLGFRIEVPANVAGGHLIDGGGEVGWFEISNPNQFSHNSFVRHEMHAHHYTARGVVGDAIKVGKGTAHHHDAYIEMDVRPGGPTDKHYDGVQVFNQGTLRLERVVIEWADAGVTANTTGALFTQTNAALFSRDLLVLNPGGTWQPVRLSGSGDHDVDRVQLIGVRRPNNNSPDKLAPTAAVKVTNGSGTFSLWNGVAGSNDWLIE